MTLDAWKLFKTRCAYIVLYERQGQEKWLKVTAGSNLFRDNSIVCTFVSSVCVFVFVSCVCVCLCVACVYVCVALRVCLCVASVLQNIFVSFPPLLIKDGAFPICRAWFVG